MKKSIVEAAYALDTLKVDCIKLATNVKGQYLGAPELDPLFGYLNKKHAVVILHPHRPEPVNKDVMKQTPLALPRMKSLIPVMQQNKLIGKIDWEKNLASLYYDMILEGNARALFGEKVPSQK